MYKIWKGLIGMEPLIIENVVYCKEICFCILLIFSMDIDSVWKHVQDVIVSRKNEVVLSSLPRIFRYTAGFPLPYEEHNCDTAEDFIKQHFLNSLM